MFEQSAAMEYQFVEFREAVYLGPKHGYVHELRLSEACTRNIPFATVRRGDYEMLRFVTDGGHSVLVPQYNVRYVYGRLASPEMKAEKKPESIAVAEDSAHRGEPMPQADAAPKRRGRPPKVRV